MPVNRGRPFISPWIAFLFLAACGSSSVNPGPGFFEGGSALDVPIVVLDEGSAEVTFDEGSPEPDLAIIEIPEPEPCSEGDSCDDGDPCTYADECKAGACSGQVYACGDGKSCTHDICDGFGGCTYPIRSDRCVINGACFEDGAPNPDDPCLACVSPYSKQSWSSNDGGSCDDGNFCTVDDTCESETCTSGPPADCEDGNACTLTGCDTETGCTTEILEDDMCDDEDACSIMSQCDGIGDCVTTVALECDDPAVLATGNPAHFPMNDVTLEHWPVGQ